VTLATLESRMAHISGFARDQLLLLPEAVDDYVGADNPVRFIDAFVDGLDLTGAGFLRVEAKATGRPGYAPGDLLKLSIDGYLNRVRSSRRLEAGVSPQHRGHLAVADAEAGLQDDRRLPARQSRRIQVGLSPVRAAVRAEFSLTALAYNLRRGLNIVGVEAMTAAVA
jgi:hypothetical protein